MFEQINLKGEKMSRTSKQQEIENLKKRIVELENVIVIKNAGITELEFRIEGYKTTIQNINKITEPE